MIPKKTVNIFFRTSEDIRKIEKNKGIKYSAAKG